MSQHRGEILQQIFKDTREKVTSVAKRMGIDRGTIYRHFDEPDLSVDYIIKYGKALGIDVTKYFPDISKQVDEETKIHLLNKPTYEELEASLNYWKDKYISLLEQYNNLLLDRL